MFKAYVYVTLKPGVLDPQGNATKGGLHALGFSEATDVRVGKFLEITLDTDRKEKAEERVRSMCEKFLSNPVIEDYRFEVREG